MTVICYKNGILCSDSQVSKGDVQSGSAKKVFKTKSGWLVGASDSMINVQKFFKWAKKEPKIKSFGDRCGESFSGIIIKPSGRVIVFYTDGYCEHDADFYALGSGQDIAIGAMAFGASARQAVECTIKYHNECGGEVQEIRL